MQLEILQEDIDLADKKRKLDSKYYAPYDCAVAQAAIRKFPLATQIGCGASLLAIDYDDGSYVHYQLSSSAQQFIKDYDNRQNVQPCKLLLKRRGDG